MRAGRFFFDLSAVVVIASCLIATTLGVSWPGLSWSVAQAQTRNGPAGVFDFYVLALSWSPGFCEAGGGDDKGRGQCATGAGLGFVTHGLWPQADRGFPIDCAPADRTPSRSALETVRGVYPDEGLARHEWRVHGSCSGKSPTDYFADVRVARDKIVLPPPFVNAAQAQTWTVPDIERAFVDANPGLRADMIAVTCRKDTLQEVRICFSKDLRSFQSCAEVDRRGCRARDVAVPPAR